MTVKHGRPHSESPYTGPHRIVAGQRAQDADIMGVCFSHDYNTINDWPPLKGTLWNFQFWWTKLQPWTKEGDMVYNWMIPVDESQKSMVLCGLAYGVHAKDYETVHDGSNWRARWIYSLMNEDKLKNMWREHDKNNRNVFYTIPGLWHWPDGAEARCIAHIKKQVTDGLLEIPRHIHSHWHLRNGMLTHAKAYNPRSVTHEQYIELELAKSDSRMKRAAYEAVKLENEMRTAFTNANDLDSTLTACKNYLDGDFGVDWFIRDAFHPDFQMKLRHDANRILDARKTAVDLSLHGSTSTHFPGNQMTPFLKRYKSLAGLFAELYN